MRSSLFSTVALLCGLLVLSPSVFGQNNNGGGGNGGGVGIQPAGIEIDAAGRARIVQFDNRTMAQRIAAQKAALAPELARPSKLRKVSLNRLESVVSEKLRKGEPISDEIKYVAGLTGIEYVFFFPETRDVVLAGPAEGFVVDVSGRPIGMNSGRCVVELQDIIAALRSFPPEGKAANSIVVSIDPTQDGLARLNQYMAEMAPKLRPQDDERFAAGMREALGQQVVSVRGISARTHFAQVLVEADYRMKLIAIGLEVPPVKIKSYAERANPSQVSQNAMERFHFVTHFDEIRVSEDRSAMQLVGNAVKLVGEHERVTAEGGRVGQGKVNVAAQEFCKQFSDKFSELADKSPVYGQLRNLVSLSVAAAYLRENNLYSLANWKLETFGDESLAPVEVNRAPTHVETAVNVIWKGQKLMTPIGGGVRVRPTDALSPGKIQVNPAVNEVKDSIKVSDLAADVWWWD